MPILSGPTSKLEGTYENFTSAGDAVNAAKVRTIQDTGIFVWVSSISQLSNIDDAIAFVREAKETTGADQIVGRVVRAAGNGTKIRGFSTNVSNYNPFNALVRENYTEYSTAWWRERRRMWA